MKTHLKKIHSFMRMRLSLIGRILPLLLIILLAFGLSPTKVVHAATLDVDRFDDVLVTACTVAANDCSLRGAISNANANAGSDTINLPAGTYTLSIAGRSEDSNATGDLDITDTSGTLTIIGASAPTDLTPTIIQAGTTTINGIDRVFDVHIGTAVTFESLIIRHGRTDQAIGGTQDDGGGIRISSGAVTVTNSAITSNAAQGGTGVDGGGIRANINSSLTMTGSIVSNNSSSDRGAGVHLDTTGGANVTGVVVNITNSTISGNSAVDDGGGIATSGTFITLTLNNATIANNSSGDAAAGDGIDFGTGTGYTIKNSIVADNGTDIACASSPTIIENFVIVEVSSGCTVSGSNNLSADPGLVALADNGGPTETHALGGGSNAIDSGDTTGTGGTATGGCLHSNAVTNINVDQRGGARAQGANKGDNDCDRGAYEFSSTQTPTVITLQNFTVRNTHRSTLGLLVFTMVLVSVGIVLRRRFFSRYTDGGQAEIRTSR